MKNRAFTLIELLVVVLIIGILAAIALPQYQKAVAKSRFAQLKVLVTAVAQAEETHYLATGEYTVDMDSLDISLPPWNSADDIEDGQLKITYPWGFCNISLIAGYCNNTDIGMYYLIYWINTTTARAGKKECGVYKDKPYALELCKNETGQATPFWENDDNAAFSYD